MTTLSVHLITYNSESYIDSTIRSILKQKTNFNYEIVVGDDCSTDKTFDIVNTFAQKHPSIFNIQQNANQLGILKNFKTTLDRCNGKYVIDLAGDDLLKHNYTLQKMVDALESDSSLGFVDSGFDELKNGKSRHFINSSLINCSKEIYTNNLLSGKLFSVGVCYNKEHLYRYVDFDKYIEMGITFEDYPILVDLIMNTNFTRINESLHLYRVHKSSYSNIKDLERQLSLRRQMFKLGDFFSKKYYFSEDIILEYTYKYHKDILHIAGLYGKKALGKEMYLALNKPKKIRLYLNYLCSQQPLIRRLTLPFRKS